MAWGVSGMKPPCRRLARRFHRASFALGLERVLVHLVGLPVRLHE
jgi:hypothetical protein